MDLFNQKVDNLKIIVFDLGFNSFKNNFNFIYYDFN
jgi:hypothetical protein